MDLSKINWLQLVKALDGSYPVPEAVYREVVTDGTEAEYADARRIQRRD